jgi:hypothetical protein
MEIAITDRRVAVSGYLRPRMAADRPDRPLDALKGRRKDRRRR